MGDPDLGLQPLHQLGLPLLAFLVGLQLAPVGGLLLLQLPPQLHALPYQPPGLLCLWLPTLQPHRLLQLQGRALSEGPGLPGKADPGLSTRGARFCPAHNALLIPWQGSGCRGQNKHMEARPGCCMYAWLQQGMHRHKQGDLQHALLQITKARAVVNPVGPHCACLHLSSRKPS